MEEGYNNNLAAVKHHLEAVITERGHLLTHNGKKYGLNFFYAKVKSRLLNGKGDC